MNNKKDKSKAKELAKKVIKVPQLVGRAVLAAPMALPRMIDKLEQDQCFADKLEFINQEIVEDQKRKEVVRISKVEGMKEIVNHLEEYLQKNPKGCYEDWIGVLHPDNITKDNEIDHRFFVEDSDHRKLWNEKMEESDCIERIVESRVSHTHPHHQIPEKQHLMNYLKRHGNACYEDWVMHLYPNNIDFSNGQISHQFYVEDSDHRHLWNTVMQEIDCVERIVESRVVESKVHDHLPMEQNMLR